MSAQSKRSTPLHYTGSLPRINATTLRGWADDPHFASHIEHIKYSEGDYSVFQRFTDIMRDLAICHTDITPPIDLFVSTALDALGETAAQKLSQFDVLKLNDNGTLCWNEQPLDPDRIVALYRGHGISNNITAPFAGYFVKAFEKFLQNVFYRQYPPSLSSYTNNIHGVYNASRETFSLRHPDNRINRVLLYLSEPGAPYFFTGDEPDGCVGVGDMVANGRLVVHGLPTAPCVHGTERERFVPVYNLNY